MYIKFLLSSFTNCECFPPKIDIYDARSSGGDIQTLLSITAEGTQVLALLT